MRRTQSGRRDQRAGARTSQFAATENGTVPLVPGARFAPPRSQHDVAPSSETSVTSTGPSWRCTPAARSPLHHRDPRAPRRTGRQGRLGPLGSARWRMSSRSGDQCARRRVGSATADRWRAAAAASRTPRAGATTSARPQGTLGTAGDLPAASARLPEEGERAGRRVRRRRGLDGPGSNRARPRQPPRRRVHPCRAHQGRRAVGVEQGRPADHDAQQPHGQGRVREPGRARSVPHGH